MQKDRKEMEWRKDVLERNIAILEKELEFAPEGVLIGQKKDDKYYYYQQSSTAPYHKRYLSRKQQDVIMNLAKKKLTEAQLADAQRELDAINAYLKKFGDEELKTDKLWKSNPALSKLVLTHCEEWQQAEYETNPYRPEQLVHEAPLGKKVRSKSESSISWGLFDAHLPQRYECLLELEGRKYYPDFTILDPITQEIVLWEHLGMWDNWEYRKKNQQRLEVFQRFGYFPGQNLILTFEDKEHPLSIARIRAEIRYHFGDWLEHEGIILQISPL